MPGRLHSPMLKTRLLSTTLLSLWYLLVGWVATWGLHPVAYQSLGFEGWLVVAVALTAP